MASKTISTAARPSVPARISRRQHADFDRVARPYRWLEYLIFGRMLEHCRFSLLPLLKDCREALVLGDGDGRFLAKLLAENPDVHAVAVDTSERMLALSRERVARVGASDRVQIGQAEALDFAYVARNCYGLHSGPRCDLVVTHFFLDCFSDAEVADLVHGIRAELAPDACWLVSEFAIPEHGLARWFGRSLVAGLYFAFRQLTGLRVQKLPDYSSIFRNAGFSCEHARVFLFGTVRSELWRRQATDGSRNGSHPICPKPTA